MQEPMSWAVPLFRAFGIRVRVHVMYIVIMLGLFLRAYAETPALWFDFLMVAIAMVFAIILVHEFGHCFAARYVDGEADEILIWPLGGLAYCRPPHTAMANFITTAGGPATHVIACAAAGLALLAGGFVPPLNPLRINSAYFPVLTNIQDGKFYSTLNGVPYVKVGTSSEVRGTEFHYIGNRIQVRTGRGPADFTDVETLTTQPLPAWALWTARFFYLNLLFFCINVFLPAYPLDGGRFLQEIVWSRTDYERGTVVAAYVGLGVGMAMVAVSMMFEMGLELLAVFIFYCSYMELKKLYETGGRRLLRLFEGLPRLRRRRDAAGPAAAPARHRQALAAGPRRPPHPARDRRAAGRRRPHGRPAGQAAPRGQGRPHRRRAAVPRPDGGKDAAEGGLRQAVGRR